MRLIGLGLALALGFALTPGAGSPVAAATRTATLPRVMTCAGKPVVKPATYVLACADANAYFVNIRWASWTALSAAATATYVQNDCAPNCAAGKFVKYPARLVLSKPTQTKYGLLYSVIRYSYSVAASTTLPLRPLSAVPTS
jgi:hypothetical protein